MEAGVADLAASGEFEFAEGGRVGEGGGQTASRGEAGAGVAGLGVKVAFDGEGATSTPAGGGHLLDEGEFVFAGGSEAADVGLSDLLKGQVILAR